MTETTKTRIYAAAQATDEAILLLTRKLRRLHPAAYADVLARLPEGARHALNAADIRADRLRDADKVGGILREYVDPWANGDEEGEG